MNFNTERKNLRKSPIDILSSHIVFLNLGNKEEILLRLMKSKTRYIHKGIKVHEMYTDGLTF